ncbi:hypothetical protein DFA_10362 [Cavenderia fasciculata]|uniref:Ankyrin repeat-containing protein n=1 Tax=Cavenderia fasciculata TaxID=261658 RepID=F4QA01_CACFS|nr:uncharacterized protein DFA_10362 [Cavenderia fasciculata]EGG15520.1 hypothetical protein DFA_10362 [Cavenderia fasciculata]|eukprot:XP_004354262.1 hypothetical protein DFA_10362 [Cavenderia fasciculata]
MHNQCYGRAASKGHFETVQWLDQNRTEGCTHRAMDYAKTLEIVQYLHKQGKPATALAMDNACLTGNLDTLNFLYHNRTEGFTRAAGVNACKSGNPELIKFLLSITPTETLPWSSIAVDLVIEKNCSLDIIMSINQSCSLRGFEYAIEHNRLDIIQYLLQQFPTFWKQSTLQKVFNHAATMGNLDIVKFLHENLAIEWISTKAMDRAASNGNLEVVKFLHLKRNEGCTTKAMDKAAANGKLEVVKFLHLNRNEGCTTKAMDRAASKGHLEMVKFLHTNRTEGCTTDAIDSAAHNSHLETVEFLHKHRTEGCTVSAILKFINSRVCYDSVKYILANKLIPREMIESEISNTQIDSNDEESDYFEMVDLINQYYGIVLLD